MEQVITSIVQQVLADLVPVLVSAVLALATWGLSMLRRWHINAVVARAILRGAGAAYLSLVEQGNGVTPSALDAAVTTGAKMVLAGPSVVPALAKAEVDAPRLTQLVRAELGKLLAADPNITPATAAR